MKKSVLAIVTILVLTFSASAQEEKSDKKSRRESQDKNEMHTLFGKHRSNGGYGAFWLGYSMVDNMNALQFGARGSWVIQHSLAIGFGGTGFINEYHYDALLDKDVFLTGGYGGMYVEPIIFPRLPVHISLPVLLGAGGISFVSYNDANWGSNYVEDYEAFLIIEPGIDLEMNLTRFMRLGLGATYRIPSSFNVGQPAGGSASADDIRGLSYNVTFKFGSF